MVCRSCGRPDPQPFLDLGHTPLADALVKPDAVGRPEDRFPLVVAYCPRCHLVQITEEVPQERLFVDNYLYFSSFSDIVTSHGRAHADNLVETRGLGADSLVVELASNDGYLLRRFLDAGVPVLGIDPAPDQAAAAIAQGVPTLTEFFGIAMAERLRSNGTGADVIIANNVMAHVPDLNGFVAGMAHLLNEDGLITVENPTVQDLIDHGEFDTVYHEHFCYYSCLSVDALVRRHGLFLNDVEYFPELHGGTLRWYIEKRDAPTERLAERLAHERQAGLDDFAYYADFGDRVEGIKADLLALLRDLADQGRTVAGYGAAAKGATLLNSVGIGTDLVAWVVDRNTHKQGLHMPGTNQEIRDPAVLLTDAPDHVLLLAWNHIAEIRVQQEEYLARGGRFIVPVPTPKVL